MSKPMHAENAADKAFNMVTKVLSLPGRLQGYVLNAVINTIDRAQTESILRESAELQRKQTQSNQGTDDKA